jgi:hypothetical protein
LQQHPSSPSLPPLSSPKLQAQLTPPFVKKFS